MNNLPEKIMFRPGTINDAETCANICFDAFNQMGSAHNFPSEFPLLEPTIEIIKHMLSNPGFYSIIAQQGNNIIGSNFLDERGSIVGIGPISVNCKQQNSGLGRQLMQLVIDRALSQNKSGIRLNTAAHHGRSLSLYSKIGFKIQAPIVVLQGKLSKTLIPNTIVRPANLNDLEAIDKLCFAVHGHSRKQEMVEAIAHGSARVVEREGSITGYTSEVSFFGHSVGKTNDDLKALIAATKEYKGAGFLLPSENHELLIWCLKHNLKVVISMVYMTIGLYNTPQGSYLPSILY